MKKIFFATYLLLGHQQAFTQPNPNQILNDANCAITVTKECYDLCVLVNSHTITVNAATNPPNNTNIIASFPTCPSGDYIIYKVCWAKGPECTSTPPIACINVDGSSPSAPPPCSPGTYTGIIQAGCDFCTPTGSGSGIVTITYNPSNNSLWIH